MATIRAELNMLSNNHVICLSLNIFELLPYYNHFTTDGRRQRQLENYTAPTRNNDCDVLELCMTIPISRSHQEFKYHYTSIQFYVLSRI